MSIKYDVLKNITFKTNSYRKNFNLISDNDNYITEHEGIINKTRISENKNPFLVGEYSFSIWNYGLANKIGGDLNKTMVEYVNEEPYKDLLDLINNNIINTNKISKLLIVNNLILHPFYRKMGLTEEFFEFLYRDYYNKGTTIVANVNPIQNNVINFSYFMKDKLMDETTAFKYYRLDKIIEKDDGELNKYKLFSLAQKCGLKRIKETNVFKYNPLKTINRIKKKNSEFVEPLEFL